jgi:hypothetical protein
VSRNGAKRPSTVAFNRDEVRQAVRFARGPVIRQREDQ